jgi:predicted nucleic acid-binding protein
MIAGYLVDTSVLRVFSSVERLDLLDSWSPLVITPEILREHGQAPPQAVKALAGATKDGRVRLEVPDLADRARRLAAENPALSFVDAETILYAEQMGYAIFVADSEFRRECARKRIQVAGVASVLLFLRRERGVSAESVRALAAAMEASGYYRFSQDERIGLGLS